MILKPAINVTILNNNYNKIILTKLVSISGWIIKRKTLAHVNREKLAK